MAVSDYGVMPMSQTGAAARATPTGAPKFEHGAKPAKGSGFDMSTEDFMTLIMAQFQNQDIMNPASTDDFLNQMVQMMTIQTMKNMNDISTISYAASLVGKEVTIGVMTGKGLEETVGVVTGTGMMNGQQVIIVDGKEYGLNQILAVGRLPEKPDDDKTESTKPDGDKVEPANPGVDKTEPGTSAAPEIPDAAQKPEGSEETQGEVTEPTEPAKPDAGGAPESGTQTDGGTAESF